MSGRACRRVGERVAGWRRLCFGLAGKMADGSGPPLPPPSRPDWSGEEEEEGSGRGVPPLHPRVLSPRSAAGAAGAGGAGCSARPLARPRTPSARSSPHRTPLLRWSDLERGSEASATPGYRAGRPVHLRSARDNPRCSAAGPGGRRPLSALPHPPPPFRAPRVCMP